MKDKLQLFLKSEDIETLCEQLGKKIAEDYRGKVSETDPLLVVVTLKGAMFFAADLLRHIDLPVIVDFVRLSSYGAGTQTTGTVRILKDLETTPEKKHVLVLDEIVDSGRTLDFMIELLTRRDAASVKVCTLLSKPSRREIEVKLDYVGQEVEDRFLVGYGLDHAERYRNLPHVYFIP